MTAVLGTAAAAEPAFPPLVSGDLRDCGAPEAKPTYCRLRKDLSLQEARQRLGTDTMAVWGEDDVFSVVAQAPGESVRVAGAVNAPLARLQGSDLWTISVRVPSLDAALLDALVGGGPNGAFVRKEWRGPKAEPKLPLTEKLTGRHFVVPMASPNLGETRKVGVYLPPNFDPGLRYPVIYMADGQGAGYLARLIELLILSGKAPPLVLVGLHNGGERRSQDYLINRKDTPDGFAAHERFFLQEVMPRAEKEWGASNRREDRMLLGHSSGAAWAVDTALRNPELFANVYATSFGWGERKDLARPQPIRFFFAAGELEGPFRRRTGQLADAAKAGGHQVTFKAVVAGHSPMVTQAYVDDALAAAFPFHAAGSAMSTTAPR
jgi:enterochelin esterase-like enzyme